MYINYNIHISEKFIQVYKWRSDTPARQFLWRNGSSIDSSPHHHLLKVDDAAKTWSVTANLVDSDAEMAAGSEMRRALDFRHPHATRQKINASYTGLRDTLFFIYWCQLCRLLSFIHLLQTATCHNVNAGPAGTGALYSVTRASW